MCEVVLHLGAHRTGTTSLQRFLKAHEEILNAESVQLFCPPDSRKRPLQLGLLHNERVLISEENLIGTMEDCLRHAELYPRIRQHLDQHAALFEKVDIVYFSIRDLADWWVSTISFCVNRNQKLPNAETLEKIAQSMRSWTDVLNEIRRSFSGARIIVREFEWKKDNPKQQVSKLTKWSIWNDTTGIKEIHNSRPATNTIAMNLMERLDFESLEKLHRNIEFQPFNESQIATLRDVYTKDLAAIRKLEGVELWEAKGNSRETIEHATLDAPVKDLKEDKICLLHIGKTGGTFIKSILSDSAQKRNVYLGGHGDTLISTIRHFGLDRRLGFFFRDPEERFVSGFQSRLRRGRPRYNINWTTEEAVAFSFFKTPNDLAEALSSEDDRNRSAAHFAFEKIFHLKQNYVHYLHSPKAIEYEKGAGNIVVCCETKNIDIHIDRILSELGAVRRENKEYEKNAAPESAYTALTEKAKASLHSHWSEEFRIYETCKAVARDLGFSS